MERLIILVALGCVIYKWIVGRWPWSASTSTRNQAIRNARRLLGVGPGSSRDDIIAAHKRLVTLVHPDRGGTADQVHEANAARDLLLEDLPGGHINQESR